MAIQLLKNAGMSTEDAFSMNMIIQAMNIVGCFLELFMINWVSRRLLLLSGMGVLAIDLILIGAMGCLWGTHGEKPPNEPALKAIAAFLIMINLWYHITIGPVSEYLVLPSSRVNHQRILWLPKFQPRVCVRALLLSAVPSTPVTE